MLTAANLQSVSITADQKVPETNDVTLQGSVKAIPKVREDLSPARSRAGPLDPLNHKANSRLSHNVVRDRSPGTFQQLQSTKAKRWSNIPPDADLSGMMERTSPTRSLFRQNRETVEDMLIRKLRTRHIDKTACFSI